MSRQNDYVNIDKVKEALAVLKPDGQLFEIRILPQGKNQTISGYFTSVDALKDALNTVNLRGANVFFSLNTIDESCYSREQHDCFCVSKVTTSDNDITDYQWLLIDLDPVRRTGISSTDSELKAACDLGGRIADYLKLRGFPEPIRAKSGNGMHLLYRIDLPSNKGNAKLVENCLKALDLLFSDDKVDIDTSVFNPSRISKLYGTLAQKGSSTKDRPHRFSEIISKPAKIEVVKKELLEKLSAELPPAPSPQKSTSSGSNAFNIEDWLNRYNISVKNVKSWNDCTKYILEECPFDNSHKAPDSCIIKMQSGAIAFKCFHDHCQGHDWKELRLMYEPDAYDDKRAADDSRIEAGWQEHQSAVKSSQNQDAPQEAGAALPDIVSLADYSERPKRPEELIEGLLRRGHKMLVSGDSKAGKSFLLMELAVAIAEGRPWLGLKCRKGRVLYVNLEIDPNSAVCRLDDIYKKLGLLNQCRENVLILNLRGHAIPLDQLAPKLIEKVKELKLDAIIVDPIYKVITGDENNATDMGYFCNQFDKICDSLGCAVIYCHHHSKGEQGGKKAMDRASGSGVFARDPDALVDLLSLNLPEELQKENMQHGELPFRMDATLREFAPMKPLYLWFEYPVHKLDEDGILSEYYERKKKKESNNIDKEAKEKERFDDWFEWSFKEGDGGVPVKDLSAAFGVSDRTIKNWVSQKYSDEYYCDKGKVYRIDVNGSTATENEPIPFDRDDDGDNEEYKVKKNYVSA